MSKTNVMHVTYDMRIGGTEMVIKNIIEGSDTSKFNMSIFCIEEPLGPWGEDLKNTGLTILSQNRQPSFDISLIRTINKAIKRQRIDVVHCHQYTPWVYGVLAAIGTKAKVIFTEHGRFYPDSSSWKRRFVNPILSLMTAKITAISKATKQALVNYEFLSENNIEVIYNGIKPLVADPKKVKILKDELKIPTDAKVLGTVARFDPIKNQTMMVRAFSEVLKTFPNTYLLLVGDGGERANLESVINQLDIAHKVILTGYIKDPVNYIAMMDVFLLSSLSEGTSMTLLEAMSLGKPCVVTDAGGNREVIEDKKNGIVVPNSSQNKFSQAIMTILESPCKTELCGLSGRLIFESKFSDTFMKTKYSAMYMHSLGKTSE